MREKISFEIKQKAVTEIESGRLSQSEAARRLGINKKTSGTHATGLTHECHSLYEIIIPILCPICKGTFAQEICGSFCADCTMQTLWKITFEAMEWFVL